MDLQPSFECAAQWTGTILGVKALLNQEILGGLRRDQFYLLLCHCVRTRLSNRSTMEYISSYAVNGRQ